MYCSNCGRRLDDGYSFCPDCGTPVSSYTPAASVAEPKPEQEATPIRAEILNGESVDNSASAVDTTVPTAGNDCFVWNILREAFSSKLFLAACILMSVQLLLSLAIPNGSLNVFAVLGTVSMWILYSNAVKNREITRFVGPVKTLKIIAKIEYVLMWVLIGAFVVLAIVCLASPDVINELINNPEISVMFGTESIDIGLMSENIMIFRIAIAVGLIFACVLLALYNIFYVRNLTKCAESFELTAQNNSLLLNKLGTVKAWLMVIGVCGAFSAFVEFPTSFNAAAVNGLSAATMIVLSIWLGKLQKTSGCK